MGNFTWDPVEMDSYIRQEGIVFIKGSGTSIAIQRFVEALSNLIQYKCDWEYTGGRCYISVVPEGIDAVKVALANKEWLSQYMRPFSEDDWDEDKYFTGWLYECLNEHPNEGKLGLKKEAEPIGTSANVVKEYITTYTPDGTRIRQLVGVRTLDT